MWKYLHVLWYVPRDVSTEDVGIAPHSTSHLEQLTVKNLSDLWMQ